MIPGEHTPKEKKEKTAKGRKEKKHRKRKHKKTKRLVPVSFLSLTKKKPRAAVFIPFVVAKRDKQQEQKHVEAAAKLLQELAEKAILGLKSLSLVVNCNNQNSHYTQTHANTEWNPKPPKASALDIRLFTRAVKIMKKGRFRVQRLAFRVSF